MFQAGVKTLGDKQIRSNIAKLWKDLQLLKDMRKRTSTPAMEAREQFKNCLSKCFNISAKDALEEIQKDKKRSDKAKETDIMFFADQLGDRKMGFTTLDKKYEKVVNKAKQKKQGIISRKQKERNRVLNNNVTSGFDADDWEDLPDDDLESSDEDAPKKKKARYIPVGGMRKRARKIKGRRISLDVPVDIIQQTTDDAVRLQVTPSQHQGILAAFINVSGGSVEEFPISDSSTRRDRKTALKKKKHRN